MDIHPALHGAAWSRSLPPGATHLDADELAGIVSGLALREDLWQAVVRHDPRVRWYERVALTDAVEVWLIGWWPGQHTGFHDHGGAAGAVAVVGGELEETVLEPTGARRSRTLPMGALLRLPATVIHRVGNVQRILPATSIHAYSPPNLELNEYEATVGVSRPLVSVPPAPALAMAA